MAKTSHSSICIQLPIRHDNNIHFPSSRSIETFITGGERKKARDIERKLQLDNAAQIKPSIHRSQLLHNSLSADLLKSLDDLLGILLRHRLLQNLGHRLDELLAINQRQTKQSLDLLDDLGFRCGVDGLDLDVEEGLLLLGREFLFFLGGSGLSRGARGHSDATNGEVGDIQAGLRIVSIMPVEKKKGREMLVPAYKPSS